MLKRIFINYRRRDGAGHAHAIYSHLGRFLPKDALFIDVDVIPYGTDFEEFIADYLDSSHTMIAVIGRHWRTGYDGPDNRLLDADDYVRLEIELALARDLSILPVLVDEARMPAPEDLPSSLEELPRLNAVILDNAAYFDGLRAVSEAALGSIGISFDALAQKAEREAGLLPTGSYQVRSASGFDEPVHKAGLSVIRDGPSAAVRLELHTNSGVYVYRSTGELRGNRLTGRVTDSNDAEIVGLNFEAELKQRDEALVWSDNAGRRMILERL